MREKTKFFKPIESKAHFVRKKYNKKYYDKKWVEDVDLYDFYQFYTWTNAESVYVYPSYRMWKDSFLAISPITKNIYLALDNYSFRSEYSHDFSLFIQKNCESFKACIEDIKTKNLRQSITISLNPNPDVHFRNFIIRLNPQKNCCEITSINGYDSKYERAMLLELKQVIQKSYPSLQIKEISIPFHQSGGDICGFMSAAITRFYDLNPNKTLEELKPKLETFLEYANTHQDELRAYVMHSLEGFCTIQEKVYNNQENNIHYFNPNSVKQYTENQKRNNVDQFKHNLQASSEFSNYYAAEQCIRDEQFFQKACQIQPQVFPPISHTYKRINKLKSEMTTHEIVHDFLASEVDYFGEKGLEKVFRRREKELNTLLDKNISREALIDNLYLYISGREICKHSYDEQGRLRLYIPENIKNHISASVDQEMSDYEKNYTPQPFF